MKEKDRPRGVCYTCVHCHLTQEVAAQGADEERKERIYECAWFNTQMTKTHFSIDCKNAYTGVGE